MTGAQAKQIDEIFKDPALSPPGFQFDRTVARVFDDMIERSVPLYAQFQDLAAGLATKFLRPGEKVVDLGCSTGRTLAAIDARAGASDIGLIGVDLSEDMLAQAAARLENSKSQIRLVQSAVQNFAFEDAISCAICLFVLQFLRPLDRARFVARIYAGLRPGGRLILGEKIIHPHPALSREYIAAHHAFKAASGYTEVEIAKKREALENVLVPFTIQENEKLLSDAGFDLIDTPLRWCNFVLFLAQKNAP